MTSFDDKLKDFICYLKDYHKNCGINWMGKDSDLLDAIRLDPQGRECYSKETERQVIMEHDTNETIHNALETLKDITHLEDIEKQVQEKYNRFLKPITIKDDEKIIKIIKNLKNLGVNITVKKLDNIVLETASIFYFWIINGEQYYIEELDPGDFKININRWCPACLLESTLKIYTTIGGWAPLTNTNTLNNDGGIKNFSYIISENVSNKLTKILKRAYLDDENLKRSKKLIHLLINYVITYLIRVSLISCWFYGKERHLKKIPLIEMA